MTLAPLPGGRQRVYSRGNDDCMRAAVATAFNVAYGETPPARHDNPTMWMYDWDQWATARGLVMCRHHADSLPFDREWWIGSIKMLRLDTGCPIAHAVVGCHDAIVFDPSRILRRSDRPVFQHGWTFDREYVDGVRVREIVELKPTKLWEAMA